MNQLIDHPPGHTNPFDSRVKVLVAELLLLAVGVLAGTNASGQNIRPPRPPSAAALGGGITFTPVEPGITYANDRDAVVPWSMSVLKIERAQKDLIFLAPHAKNTVLGVSILAEQAASIPAKTGRAVAAVNADFYERSNKTFAGDPRGMQVVDGELVSAPDTVCVWFDASGNPHMDQVKGEFKITWPQGERISFGLNEQRRNTNIVLYTPTYGPSTRVSNGRDIILEKDGNGPWLPLEAGQTYRAKVREVRLSSNLALPPDAMVLSVGPEYPGKVPAVEAGTVLEISTATTPDLKGVKTVVGGGPELIRDGKAFSQMEPPPGTTKAYSDRSKYERHPRSAIGWNATHIFMVIVDGRQEGLSVGMKLAELAQYMAKLGCTDAMNFDGGNSAQMWMNGRIMNSPCHGEDTVANSLMLVRKPANP